MTTQTLPPFPIATDPPAPLTDLPTETPIATAMQQCVRVVLVSPSHPGNIGSTARAMKTMGLTELVLVNPREENPREHPEALALATGAADILGAARIYGSLHEALADCQWAVAVTARVRDLSPPEVTPRTASAHALSLASSGMKSAFVFGNERYGLDNEDVLTCQACCTIPTSATYSSLNLSQAVQIVVYECLLASVEHAPSAAAPGEPLATLSEREQMFAHLDLALTEIGFLNPGHPKRLSQRIRRLFSRTDLEQDEVNILRGICTAILSPRR